MAHVVPQRSELAPEYTWDINNVFASDAAWEAAVEQVSTALNDIEPFRGHLSDSAATLADWFATSERILDSMSKIALYASMAHNVNTGDQAAAARDDRATGLYSQVAATLAFAEPEILAIDAATLHCWTSDEPRLATYAHYFDQLERRRAHIRSAEVEQLLGSVGAPFASAARIHGVLADADLRFSPARTASGEAVDVAQGNISALLADADRELRRSAWESYADAHLALKNTMAGCLATGVKQQVFAARVRNYPSALEAAVAANDIPVAVFHNLIETFRKHLPTWHRYWRVRQQALGYDTLHVYDIKAPLARGQQPLPFAQVGAWIAAGMQPLGEEYVSTLQRGLLEQRWVDLYPNQGKRMGAYSHGVQGTHPFILMSYDNDLFSLSTLAHELGHSMHSYYTWQKQPFVYSEYSIFVAEVASNFNQALVRAHLLQENSDPEFQIAVIEEAMSNFHRYFFIMPTLARFELAIHEQIERGEALSADGMLALLTSLFQEGYGDAVEIDHDRIGSTWMQFHTHLYSNFYVYQYATGISAAHALAAKILAGEPGARENYLTFLSTGSAEYPLDALKIAGVDMTSPEPVEQTFQVLASFVDRLEALVSQRAAA